MISATLANSHPCLALSQAGHSDSPGLSGQRETFPTPGNNSFALTARGCKKPLFLAASLARFWYKCLQPLCLEFRPQPCPNLAAQCQSSAEWVCGLLALCTARWEPSAPVSPSQSFSHHTQCLGGNSPTGAVTVVLSFSILQLAFAQAGSPFDSFGVLDSATGTVRVPTFVCPLLKICDLQVTPVLTKASHMLLTRLAARLFLLIATLSQLWSFASLQDCPGHHSLRDAWFRSLFSLLASLLLNSQAFGFAIPLSPFNASQRLHHASSNPVARAPATLGTSRLHSRRCLLTVSAHDPRPAPSLCVLSAPSCEGEGKLPLATAQAGTGSIAGCTCLRLQAGSGPSTSIDLMPLHCGDEGAGASLGSGHCFSTVSGPLGVAVRSSGTAFVLWFSPGGTLFLAFSSVAALSPRVSARTSFMIWHQSPAWGLAHLEVLRASGMQWQWQVLPDLTNRFPCAAPLLALDSSTFDNAVLQVWDRQFPTDDPLKSGPSMCLELNESELDHLRLLLLQREAALHQKLEKFQWLQRKLQKSPSREVAASRFLELSECETRAHERTVLQNIFASWLTAATRAKLHHQSALVQRQQEQITRYEAERRTLLQELDQQQQTTASLRTQLHEIGQALVKLCVCPITMTVMKEPVMGPDTHTYEKEAIVDWLQNHETSPVTRVPMVQETLRASRVTAGVLAVAKEHWSNLEALRDMGDQPPHLVPGPLIRDNALATYINSGEKDFVVELLGRELSWRALNSTFSSPTIFGTVLHLALCQQWPDVAILILKRMDFCSLHVSTECGINSIALAALFGFEDVIRKMLSVTGSWYGSIPLKTDTAYKMSNGRIISLPKGWKPVNIARRMRHASLASFLSTVMQDSNPNGRAAGTSS